MVAAVVSMVAAVAVVAVVEKAAQRPRLLTRGCDAIAMAKLIHASFNGIQSRDQICHNKLDWEKEDRGREG